MWIKYLLVVCAALLLSQNALSCSCRGVIVDTSIVVKHTATVVMGEVIHAEPGFEIIGKDTMPLARYTLVVQKWYAGINRLDTMFIQSRSESDACGYVFELGKRYIVFSQDQNDSGMVRTNMCTLTTTYSRELEARIKKELKIYWP